MSPPASGRLRSGSSGAHSRSRTTSVAPSDAASAKSSPRTVKAAQVRPSVRVNTFTALSTASTASATAGSGSTAVSQPRSATNTATQSRAARVLNQSLSVSGTASASPSLSARTAPQHADTIHTSQLLAGSSASCEPPEPASQLSVARVASDSQAVVLASGRQVSASAEDEEGSKQDSRASQSSAASVSDADDDEDERSLHKSNDGSNAAIASPIPVQLRNGFGQLMSKDRAEELCATQTDLVCVVSLPLSPRSPTAAKLTLQQLSPERAEKRELGGGAAVVDVEHPFQHCDNKEDGPPVAVPSPALTALSPSPTAVTPFDPAALSASSTPSVLASLAASAASTARSPTNSTVRSIQPATLSPPQSTTAANQRRTLNHSSALPRLPFLASPTAAFPSSNAPPTAAGSEGFLASLNPAIASPRAAHSVADPLLSSDAVAAGGGQHRSPSLVVRSTRPFILHRNNKHSTLPAEAKRATFFASVAHALGRMSVTQQRMNGPAGIAGLADLAVRRPSLSSLMANKRNASPPQLPLLKTGDEVTEVTSMSPNFLAQSATPLPVSGSPHFFQPTPTHTASASPITPTTAAQPVSQRYYSSLVPGNYTHHSHPHSAKHPSARLPAIPAPGSGGELDEKFLESWSESDDPLSPASFQQIVPGVYLGSAKSAMNVDRLIQHRITHILTVMNRPLNFLAQAGDIRDADILSFTVQRDSNGQAAASSSPPTQVPRDHPLFSSVMHALTTHFVYLLDLPEADLLSALNECIPYLLHAHLHCGGRVLIHCQAGISRSASVVMAYLVRLYGWSVRQAYEVCYEARPYVHPNEGFVSQLELFARSEERRKRKDRRRWREWLRRGGWLKNGGGKERWWKARTEDVRPRLLPAEARMQLEGGRNSARWRNKDSDGT